MADYMDLDNVDVWKSKQDFDYTSWFPTGSSAKLCTVKWKSDYQDICDWPGEADRENYFNNIAGRTISELGTLRDAGNGRFAVKLPDAQISDQQYNYLVVDTAPYPTTGGPRQSKFYYFIEAVDFRSPESARLVLTPDYWTTYFDKISMESFMVESGHAALIKQASPQNYLNNPANNRQYLPNNEAKGKILKAVKEFSYEDGQIMAVVASWAALTGDFSGSSWWDGDIPTIADPPLHPSGFGYNNLHYFLTTADEVGLLMENARLHAPQALTHIAGVTLIPRNQLVIDESSHSISNGVNMWGLFVGAIQHELGSFDLVVSDFAIPAWCADMTELYDTATVEVNGCADELVGTFPLNEVVGKLYATSGSQPLTMPQSPGGWLALHGHGADGNLFAGTRGIVHRTAFELASMLPVTGGNTRLRGTAPGLFKELRAIRDYNRNSGIVSYNASNSNGHIGNDVGIYCSEREFNINLWTAQNALDYRNATLNPINNLDDDLTGMSLYMAQQAASEAELYVSQTAGITNANTELHTAIDVGGSVLMAAVGGAAVGGPAGAAVGAVAVAGSNVPKLLHAAVDVGTVNAGAANDESKIKVMTDINNEYAQATLARRIDFRSQMMDLAYANYENVRTVTSDAAQDIRDRAYNATNSILANSLGAASTRVTNDAAIVDAKITGTEDVAKSAAFHGEEKFGNWNLQDTRMRRLTVKVLGEDSGVIQQRAMHLAMYGSKWKGIIEPDVLVPGGLAWCRWKVTDGFFVGNPGVSNEPLNRIKRVFTEGCRVWADPAIVGEVGPKENWESK